MKRLFLVALFGILLAYPAESGNFYLLSVGIADYSAFPRNLDIGNLNLPVEDAKTIASIYKQCTKAHTVLLLDENATRENIVREAESLFLNAGEQDVVIFFFSGHGFPGCFCAYDGNLTYGEIKRIFASCKAAGKIIFADACFSGGIRKGGRPDYSGLGSDVMFFLSSRGNEYSIERKNMKNGFFTACLARCLKGGADDNRDRIITAKELYEGVRKGVVKLSQDRQHPVMWGKFNDDMVVINWNYGKDQD